MVGRIPIVRGNDFARSGNVEVNLVTRAWDGFTSSIAYDQDYVEEVGSGQSDRVTFRQQRNPGDRAGGAHATLRPVFTVLISDHA
jgi:hypothetical protein